MGAGSDTRWTWIFATVGLLVVIVVIGFLIGIVNALDSIDDGLQEADSSVTDVKGNVRPLPDYIEDINGNLRRIDRSLKPISGQATAILGSLTTINGSLDRVNGKAGSISSSLVSTSGSLVDTSGTLGGISGSLVNTSSSLVDTSGSLRGTSGTLRGITSSLRSTSGVLVNVRGLVRSIDGRLKLAQRRESLGTAEIPINVARANAVLTPIRADTLSIVGGLTSVNRHLTSICKSRVLEIPVPGVVRPGPDC